MCGLVGYVGKVDEGLINRLVEEAKVRGLHHLGSKTFPGGGIYHTRYCTSGGTHQPIGIKGNWIALNGVIDMGTKEEMEKRWRVRLETDNDAEIALLHAINQARLNDFLKLRISVAAMVLNRSELMAFRNEERPLWMHKPSKGGVVLASTKDIFYKSGVTKNLTQLEPYKIYRWTL
jgi:asparagine synthetase B (glutamine-hydrolysing)